MAVPWLLIAVLGLRESEVSCQNSATDFGSPPPLPTAGMLLCIYIRKKFLLNFIPNKKEKFLQNFIPSRDGPEKRTETRQG